MTPYLMLIADPAVVAVRSSTPFEAFYLRLVASAAEAKARHPAVQVLVQLRLKSTGDRRRWGSWCRLNGAGAEELGVLLLMNGSSAAARSYGYAGAHWPEVVRQREPMQVSDGQWTTAAVHDLWGASDAARRGADAVVFAPVWGPRSKSSGEARGTPALSMICAWSPLPVLALGGVTVDRVAECFQVGARGIASLGGLVDAADLRSEVLGLAQSVHCAHLRNVNRCPSAG